MMIEVLEQLRDIPPLIDRAVNYQTGQKVRGAWIAALVTCLQEGVRSEEIKNPKTVHRVKLGINWFTSERFQNLRN